MKVTLENFEEFQRSPWNDKILYLRPVGVLTGAEPISIEEIDVLREHPEVDTVTISGLHQNTFEYFIRTYGYRLKAINFFKNKLVEDWSLLGTLPQLEFLDFFINQRIDSYWDMSGNKSLKALGVKDFTRLKRLDGIETAPALEYLHVGDMVWDKTVLESLAPLAKSTVRRFKFNGKKILSNDFSFLEQENCIEELILPSASYTTEQAAWMAANFPKLAETCMKAVIIDNRDYYADCGGRVHVIGKGKPSFNRNGNEKRIAKYVAKFEALVEKYRGMSYCEAFGEENKE